MNKLFRFSLDVSNQCLPVLGSGHRLFMSCVVLVTLN